MLSPKSKSYTVQPKEYKYIIQAHGAIITRNEGNVTKYMAIKIPENVEIFTYANLGEILWSSCTKNYFICDNLDKVKSYNFPIETPIHKYKYISETQNKFPEIALSADTKTTLAFYSGIVHCIPKHRRTTKAMEVIYNIDALVKQNCDKTTIGRSRGVFKTRSKDNTKVYDTEEQYSTHYKTQLENYKYDPTIKDTEDNVSNKCGPLLLSQAIKVIQAHCKARYPDCNTSTIQIYLSCCFGTMEIKTHNLLRDQFFITSKEEYKKELAKLDITDGLEPRDDEQMENYYKIKEGYYSLDMNSIINHNLYTTYLRDFDSSKTLASEEETEDGNSYSYIYMGKQIILIVLKLGMPKYETQTHQHFRKITYDAIYRLHTHLNKLNVKFDELPNKITIDLRYDIPTKDKIYDKLLQVAKESKLNSQMIGQVEAAETAAANQRDLINSVRREAEAAERETAARETAAREAIQAREAAARKKIQAIEAAVREKAQERETEAREAKERAQARKKAAQETAEIIEELRKVRKAATEREAEREAEAREAESREAEREAEAREAEREVNNKTRRHPPLTPRRSRVAPEYSEDLNTNKSQNRSRTIVQRLGSLFSRKSRKVAPEPVIAGIKTKFKRKHRRRITRRHISKNISRIQPLYKIKTHSIPSSYDKKTFKKPITLRRRKYKSQHNKKIKL